MSEITNSSRFVSSIERKEKEKENENENDLNVQSSNKKNVKSLNKDISTFG